jgi:hypothetical protein
MGNRVLQQKVLKIKRMKRAYLKRFSTKNTGPSKFPWYLNDKGDLIDMSVKARSKTAAVQDLERMNEQLRKKFKFKLSDPESIYARHSGLHTDMTRDGELILARLVQSRSGVGNIQGEVRYVYQEMHNRPTSNCRLYMANDENFFVELRQTERGKFFLTSIIYSNRQMAVLAYRNGHINWKSSSEIPET